MKHTGIDCLQELIEKRSKLMKDFEEIRNKQIEEWDAKKPQRLALRNCKFCILT